jgi:EAL and modified HD-GYP domain-containing signal transduction protein
MTELMARELEPDLTDAAYTVGLVSALGLLLHVSITQIVESLSLSRELESAVLEHSGVLGGIMADVLAWEVGGENFQLRSGAPPEEVERCYLHALAWANEVCGVLALTG